MTSPLKAARRAARPRLPLRTLPLAVAMLAGAAVAAPAHAAAASGTCHLQSPGGRIQHVIYLQFDNVHLRRDNPNVPSDLEQMPHLLHFLESHGTVLNRHYTVLISHTAAGVVSSLTGLYPDRMGLTVSNSYDFYKADGTATYSSAFKYWTSPVSSTDDPLPNLVNADSGTPRTAPAPWVTYTRAGCDVGNVSSANMVLENNSVAPGGDIYNVYGAGSPEAAESSSLRTTDFVGIAVHCAQGAGSVCAGNAHAKADLLPDEPGGYDGYQALFGAKYVNPAITGGQAAVMSLDGQPVADANGNPGFPGFDGMTATNALGYVAQMQEAGIPVTYAYLSDLHDDHAGGGAFGPGEAGYEAGLKRYDDAFGKFLARLAGDGIDASNTLFVVTADENDHYAGEQAPGCDGVNTACTYNTAPGMAISGRPAHGVFDLTNGGAQPFVPPAWPPAGANGPLVGEVAYNLQWLLGASIAGTGYQTSFDSAPSFYIDGQPQAVDANGQVVVNPVLRAFEHAAANLSAFDPYLDATAMTPVARYLVDAPTLKAIHMINADPRRSMSFTMFSQPDFHFQTYSPCPSPSQGCVSDSYAWIHGDYFDGIGQTWLGLVGPGVAVRGVDDRTWTDHADIVPTMTHLVGLSTDYRPDGRVITQALTPAAAGRGGHGTAMTSLGNVYKQLGAPYGSFAHALIVASTRGIQADDTTYLRTEQSIQRLAARRDALVARMRQVLDHGDAGRAGRLAREGRALILAAQALARS